MSSRSPVPSTPHFSPARQVVFCDHLSHSGNVRAACAAAGVSAPTVYKARRRCAAFARAWDAALVLAREAAEAVLAARALDGVEEAVFYHGEEVATRRRYDSRLLLAHLARLDRRCERAEPGEEAADFDTLLAQLAGQAPDHSTCEELIEARVDAAEQAGIAAMESGEEEWDETGPDPILLAMEEARLSAQAEWEARRAALFGQVDRLVESGRDESGAALGPRLRGDDERGRGEDDRQGPQSIETRANPRLSALCAPAKPSAPVFALDPVNPCKSLSLPVAPCAISPLVPVPGEFAGHGASSGISAFGEHDDEAAQNGVPLLGCDAGRRRFCPGTG